MSTSTTRAYYQTKDQWRDGGSTVSPSEHYTVGLSPSLVMVPSPPSPRSEEGANELILETLDKAKLVFVVIGWYIFSSLSNNINKNILRLHPYPILLTAVQFAFISIYTLALLQFLGRKVLSNINMTKIYKCVVPLSFGHIFAHLFTQISIGTLFFFFDCCNNPFVRRDEAHEYLRLIKNTTKIHLGSVPVSFTHTVKASSPIFTVILSKVYLGEVTRRSIIK